MNKFLKLSLLLSVSLTVIFAATFQILDPDTVNYLAYGKYILYQGLPHRCVFTYTINDCPIAYSEWFLQVLIYQIYSLGGWSALVLLQMFITVSILIIIYLANKEAKVHPVITALFILLSLFVLTERFMLRADFFSLPLAAFIYFLMYSYQKNKLYDKPFLKQIPFIIPLLLIQLLWANTHGSFPLGWIIVISFIVPLCLSILKNYLFHPGNKKSNTLKKQTINLIIIFIMVIAVSYLNPYGLDAFLWPIKNAIDTNTKLVVRTIAEYSTPFTDFDFIRLSIIFYKVLIVMTIILFLHNFRKINPADISLMIFFFFLSSSAVRYLSIFGLFSALILPKYFETSVGKIYYYLKNKINLKITTHLPLYITSCLLIIYSSFISYGYVTNKLYRYNHEARRFGFGVSRLTYPEGAVKFILENKLRPNMFNSYIFGGYLNWRLYPNYKTYIHGSSWGLDYIDSVWFYGDYRALNIGKISYQEIVEKNSINFFVIDYPNSLTAELVQNLYRDPNWAVVYLDHLSIIYIAKKEENKEIIDKFQINLSQDDAINSLELELITNEPTMVHNNLGRLYGSLGLLQKANKEFQQAVQADPNDYFDYNNLGSNYRKMDKYTKAIESYYKAISINPKFASARYNLASLFLEMRTLDKAKEEFIKTLKIDKNYPKSHYHLGLISEIQGNKKEAWEQYQQELKIQPNYKLALEGLKRLAK